MITIHYDYTDGTEVSYAEGRELKDGFTTNCLDFFQNENDVTVLKSDGSYMTTTEIQLNDGRYGQKHIRPAHNLQRMLKAGALKWQSNATKQARVFQ